MAQAKSLSREFLDASNEGEIAEKKQKLSNQYIEKYHELAKTAKPSFWFGVLQSFVASFLFLLAGYIILKMNGSWDILLSNLFK